MRKIHLISITDPLVLELTHAIHDKGYEVSVSGTEVSSELEEELEQDEITSFGNGWFPEKLTKNTYSVVLGSNVTQDNPEFQRAKELGLLIQSIPEFIYQRTKSKTRVVIAGSRGRKIIIAMIAAALRKQKMAFDYAILHKEEFKEGVPVILFSVVVVEIDVNWLCLTIFKESSPVS